MPTVQMRTLSLGRSTLELTSDSATAPGSAGPGSPSSRPGLGCPVSPRSRVGPIACFRMSLGLGHPGSSLQLALALRVFRMAEAQRRGEQPLGHSSLLWAWSGQAWPLGLQARGDRSAAFPVPGDPHAACRRPDSLSGPVSPGVSSRGAGRPRICKNLLFCLCLRLNTHLAGWLALSCIILCTPLSTPPSPGVERWPIRMTSSPVLLRHYALKLGLVLNA